MLNPGRSERQVAVSGSALGCGPDRAGRLGIAGGRGWNGVGMWYSPVMGAPKESGISPQDVCAVILAGGKSRRMGRDKALLEIDGEPMVQRLARLAMQVASEVLLSANHPTPYSIPGLPIVPDIYASRGPMAGIHATMNRSCRDVVLVIACDLPRLQAGLLHLILRGAVGHDIVVPRTTDGRLHPLCACYRRTLLPEIERRLRANRCRLTDLICQPAIRVLEITTGFNDLDLVNWNTPKDLLP